MSHVGEADGATDRGESYQRRAFEEAGGYGQVIRKEDLRARLFGKLHLMAMLIVALPMTSSSCSIDTSLLLLTSNAQIPQMMVRLWWYKGSWT